MFRWPEKIWPLKSFTTCSEEIRKSLCPETWLKNRGNGTALHVFLVCRYRVMYWGYTIIDSYETSECTKLSSVTLLRGLWSKQWRILPLWPCHVPRLAKDGKHTPLSNASLRSDTSLPYVNTIIGTWFLDAGLYDDLISLHPQKKSIVCKSVRICHVHAKRSR